MGGASGVAPARVVVLGAGMAGLNAAWIAAGMEAEVAIVDKNVDRLRYVDQIQRGRIQTVMSAGWRSSGWSEADLVIGAVLIPGAKAPHLVTEEMVARDARRLGHRRHLDRPGGCVETSHMTTHSEPTYVGTTSCTTASATCRAPCRARRRTRSRTSRCPTRSTSRTGTRGRRPRDAALALGVNVYGGRVTNAGVAEAHGLAFTSLGSLVDGLG